MQPTLSSVCRNPHRGKAIPQGTVVDKIGMGDAIQPYNEHMKEVTKGIYTAFGIDGMLKVKVA